MSGLLQITQVTYSNNPLLIVGSGPWAGKIQKILTKNISNIEIFRVSAHDFLDKNLPKELDPLTDYNLWIATRPEIQLVILDKIKDQSGLCILEKPVATNLEQMKRYYQLTQGSRMDFAISKPWNFSQLWSTAKENIYKRKKKVNIEIWRGDVEQRSYLPPYMDWLPHDIYLLSELLLGVESLEISAKWSNREKKVEISLSSLTNFQVKMHIGHFKGGRRALWHVRSEGASDLTVDFNKGEITTEKIKTHRKEDDPITTMYKEYCKKRGQFQNNVFLFQAVMQKIEEIKKF